MRDVNGNKKGLYRFISSKRKVRENVASLMNGAGILVTKTMMKAEILNAFSTLVFAGKICPQ